MCSTDAERCSQLTATAICCHHCGARDLPIHFYPDFVDHGPVPVDRCLKNMCPLVLEEFGVLCTTDKVSCFIFVGYVYPNFFGGTLALVECSDVLTSVHVWRVGPRGKEVGPDFELFLVEDGRVRFELINHRARCIVDITDVVLMLISEVLLISVGDDRGDGVEVCRLLEVLIVPHYPVLCGEYLLVCGGGGFPDAWVEECQLVDAAAVQRVVFCNPLDFFLFDDERKAASIPAVSMGFEARRDHCNCSDKFVNWPKLGRSCDYWEIACIEAGFDHCVDVGITCSCHGERVVGLRHALKDFVTTDSQWAYIDELIRWFRNYGGYG